MKEGDLYVNNYGEEAAITEIESDGRVHYEYTDCSGEGEATAECFGTHFTKVTTEVPK